MDAPANFVFIDHYTQHPVPLAVDLDCAKGPVVFIFSLYAWHGRSVVDPFLRNKKQESRNKKRMTADRGRQTTKKMLNVAF